MNIQDHLKNYIESQFLFEPDQQALEPDADLLNQGIIDSMGVLQLITYMEETFGIQVSDEEITPENFRSLNTLMSLVQQRNRGSTDGLSFSGH